MKQKPDQAQTIRKTITISKSNMRKVQAFALLHDIHIVEAINHVFEHFLTSVDHIIKNPSQVNPFKHLEKETKSEVSFICTNITVKKKYWQQIKALAFLHDVPFKDALGSVFQHFVNSKNWVVSSKSMEEDKPKNKQDPEIS